jgi:predicted phosphoribosyltransferase
MFKDRRDAGTQLARKLPGYRNLKDVVVLAIPRGGLPLGAAISLYVKAPLDVAHTKKIGHPENREYAIGAVSLNSLFLHDTNGCTQEYIDTKTAELRDKLKIRDAQYYTGRSSQNLSQRTVIIVDSGMASGSTILATIYLVRQKNPKKIIAAVPVASRSAISILEGTKGLDELICLESPKDFRSVGHICKACV